MTKLRILIALGFWIGVTCAVTPVVFAQSAQSFTIYIPQKVPAGAVPNPFPPIGLVKARISVHSDQSVTFTVTSVRNTVQAFAPMAPGAPPQTLTFLRGDPNGDTVTLQSIPGPGPTYEYVIDFRLRRDSSDLNCHGMQAANPNQYKVEVTSGPQITNVCLKSYDGRNRNASTPTNRCTNSNLGAYAIPVPLDDPRDMVATLTAPPEANQPKTDMCQQPNPPTNLKVTGHATVYAQPAINRHTPTQPLMNASGGR